MEKFVIWILILPLIVGANAEVQEYDGPTCSIGGGHCSVCPEGLWCQKFETCAFVQKMAASSCSTMSSQCPNDTLADLETLIDKRWIKCGPDALCCGECGVSSHLNAGNSLDTVLNNWTAAGDKEFPWQCYLGDNERRLSCGCTIISQKLVMTTAQCIYEKNIAEIFVTVGTNQQISGPNPNRIPVVALNIHPSNSQGQSGDFDIAIVELSSYLTFDDAITPTCLPMTPNGACLGNQTTVTGWSKTLQQITVNDSSVGSGHDLFINQSGGGLQCQDPDNPDKWILQGFVSTGSYFNISSVLDWIAPFLGNNDTCVVLMHDGHPLDNSTLIDQSGFNTLLLANGIPGNESRATEVVNLNPGRASKCNKTLGSFKMTLYDNTGGLLQDDNDSYPIICGGFHQIEGPTSLCHCLSSSTLDWIPLDKRMAWPRQSAASIVIDNGRTLWITGGQGWFMPYWKSTELISLDAKSFTIQTGPDLPKPLIHHCLVKLNSSTAMLIGGWTGRGVFEVATYFLDIPAGSGTTVRSVRGPDLNLGRTHMPACGVLNNPGDGNGQVVVVVGGSGPDGCTKSTEMYVVGSSQGWTKGPDFPNDSRQYHGLPSPDGKSFLVVSGVTSDKKTGVINYSKTIFQLKYENGHCWQWTKLDREIKMGRQAHNAMLVPEYFC